MTPFELLEKAAGTRAIPRPWKRVLVPIDGSDVSTWVLDRARRILEGPELSVTLLRVVECGEARAAELAYRLDPRHRETSEALAGIRARFLAPSLSAKAQLRFGDPAGEILRETAEGGHDLVVMSTHGRSRLGGLRLGGVAERVLQASPVPLLLFRPMMGPDESLSAAATRDAAGFRRLLVMLDGLEAAEEILPMAGEVALAFDSQVTLFGAIFAGSREAAKRREAEEYFRTWAAALAARGIDSRVHVCTGDPASEALALMHRRSIDSVALMTHGRSGLARAIHGSVAQRLIRESGRPVLVLRDRGLRDRPPVAAGKNRQLWVD